MFFLSYYCIKFTLRVIAVGISSCSTESVIISGCGSVVASMSKVQLQVIPILNPLEAELDVCCSFARSSFSHRLQASPDRMVINKVMDCDQINNYVLLTKWRLATSNYCSVFCNERSSFGFHSRRAIIIYSFHLSEIRCIIYVMW